MAAQLKIIGSGLESGNLASSGMDRQKALEAALAQIDRAFGKGSAMKLGSREKIEIETIPTGSLGLDIALGVGGLRRHVYKMELKALDEERAEARQREEEAQRAYNEELQRMLDKAAMRAAPRIRSL